MTSSPTNHPDAEDAEASDPQSTEARTSTLTADRPEQSTYAMRRSAAAARLRASGTLVGFIALIAVFGILRPEQFLKTGNFFNILEQVAVLAIVASLQTVVMIVGDFDLSVGALASLSGVVTAALIQGGMPFIAAIAVALLVGLSAGLLNGFLVAYVGLSAFITTLATMTAFSGLALLISNGTTIFGLPESFVAIGQNKAGPIAIPALIALGIAAVVWFLTTRTTAGRRWYALGGNAEAARLSGIAVRRSRVYAFVLCSLGATVAGIVLTARLASAHPNAGDPMMLTSIAAVFLGMTMIRTGQANLLGTLVGIGILGVMQNGLNLLHVNDYVQQVLTGAIIIVAVAISRIGKRRT